VEETFDWAQQWYPLFFVADLSTEKPTPTQLLGKDLVVWRAPDGAWSALEDLCPHRLAPLSGAPPRSRQHPSCCRLPSCWHMRNGNGRAPIYLARRSTRPSLARETAVP